MKRALSVLLMGVCMTQAVSAQDRSRGKDMTPAELQEKLYKWGKEKGEGGSLAARLVMMGASSDSQWLNRSTDPFDGFVVLPTGERFVGQTVLHNRRTAQAKRGASTNPDADLIVDITITHDGKSDKFELGDVAAFGAQFKPSEWAPNRKSKDVADRFNAGWVQLDNDARLEGVVALTSSEKTTPALRTFDRVYFANNFESPVQVYLTPRTAKAGVPNVAEAAQKGETEAAYHLLGGGLVDQNAWIAQLERDPKKLQTERLMPGEVLFANGAALKGRIGFEAGKSKSNAFMVDEDGDLLALSVQQGIKVITTTDNGVAQRFVVLNGEFINNEEAIKRFEKTETLHPGKVTLASGDVLVGSVSLRRASNLVKSYRIPLGTYFLPKADQALLSYYAPDDVEFVEEEADGAVTRYAPVDSTLVSQDKYLASLESSHSKTLTRNLQAGYVMLADGSKVSGRIAQRNGAIILVDAGSHFKRYRPADKGLAYYVQTIDGVDHRFIPLQGGVHAFSGPEMEFVELFGADKAYSWYRNPNPTHLKKFATAMAKGAINTASDVGRVQLANAAAKQQVKEAVKNNPNDIGAAVVAGAQAQQGVLDKTAGMVDVSEGGIYHKEWIVVNNTTKERIAIYSGNDSQELTRLLNQCSKYSALEPRAAKRLTDVGNLEAAANFLNSCR